jgi:fructose/tagatose bisphosphate aldolase
MIFVGDPLYAPSVFQPGRVAMNSPVIASAADGTPTIAPGSIASIAGTGLSLCTAANHTSTLPTTLCGTSVTIDGQAAPLLYVSANQINLLVPRSVVPGRDTRIVVTREDAETGADVVSGARIASVAPVPLGLHLNHCTDAQYAAKCAELGYTSVMIDGSRLPYEQNIQQTCQVVEDCHRLGDIPVEGALGIIAGPHGLDASFTDPRQGAAFVEATCVDMFAPAIGTAHGVYRSRSPQIDFERLAHIYAALNDHGRTTPLVIHGCTGLPLGCIRKLQRAGGTKLNISTAITRTLIDAQISYLAANPAEYEPWKIDVAVRDATRKVVGQWMEMLGSAGRA